MEQERYEIVKLLGKGRTGGVYEAEDLVLGRRVAMRRFFDIEGDADHSRWEDSFMSITQSLCALQHPGIATVFDAGVDDDGAYIVSQLLNGQPLSERLKEGPINEWDVYQTTEGTLDALAAAHAAGFFHGAFNPSSIIRVPRASGGYRNIIVDLGLSRLAPLIQGESSSFALMAEPTMMAPEQFDGSPATVQSDLYMVGQFAYICLVGGHPFAGMSMEDAAVAHATEPLKPLCQYDNGVCQEFSDWVDYLLQKNPADRPQSIADALAALPKLLRPVDFSKNPSQLGPTPGAMSQGPVTSITEGNRSAAAAAHLHNTAAANVNAGGNPVAQTITGSTTLVASQRAASPAGPNPLVAAPPVTGTVGVRSATAAQQRMYPGAAKKSKAGLWIGLSLGGVALIAIVIFFALGSDDKPVSDQRDVEPEEVIKPTKKKERLVFTTKATFSQAVQAGPFGIDQTKQVNVSLANATDWLCVSSAPLNAGALSKQGGYLAGVGFYKGCKEVKLEQYSYRFINSGAGKPLIARVKTDSKSGGLKKGAGYRVLGMIPRKHKGPLRGRVYFSHWNSKVRVDVKFSGRPVDASSFGAFVPKEAGGGAYYIDFEVERPEPRAEFEILIYSDGEIVSPSSLVLNAVIIK